MPQTCSVCRSKHAIEINRELISGRPFRNIAEHYSLSATAVFRHKRAHLPEKLALAKQNQDTLSAESLLAEMADVKARLRRGLEQAEKEANPAAFVAFAREFRQSLESYFAISERVAERTRATGGFSLATVIAEARARLARVGEEESGPSGELREPGAGGVAGGDS